MLLLVAVAVGAGGLGIDRWRRANPDAVTQLETLDRTAPPPAASERVPQRALAPRSPARDVPSSPHDPPARREPRPTRRLRADDTTPVDVNLATAAEFARLPGVGPALAARIIELRGRDGPFASVDDLRRVRGVGDATLARLRPRLAVNTP